MKLKRTLTEVEKDGKVNRYKETINSDDLDFELTWIGFELKKKLESDSIVNATIEISIKKGRKNNGN